MHKRLIIPITPVTKKNSQRIVRYGTRSAIRPSAKYEQYEKDCMRILPHGWLIDRPITVKAVFYMPTRRRCDLTNLLEAVDDVLVKAKIITDDYFGIIASHDGSRVRFDANHPRTEIDIYDFEEE